MSQHRRGRVIWMLFIAGIGILFVYLFGDVADHALRSFYKWLPGFSDFIPSGTGFAESVWRVVGILMATVVLLAVFSTTARIGRINPSGAHGISGIITGLTLLIFTTAFMYSEGYVFWFSLVVGVIVSVVLKVLFAYLRMRLQGDAQPQGMHYIYHRRVIRRE